MNTTSVKAMMNDKPADGASNETGSPSQTSTSRSVSLRENRVDSRELFQGAREITIAHGDETYRLRITAQNKLILTK